MLKRIIKAVISLVAGIGCLILGACAAGSGSKNSSNPNVPATSSSSVPQEELLLANAVIAIGGGSAKGVRNALLCSIARDHLQYMNEVGGINHDGFSERSKKIQAAGGSNVGEIVAYNTEATPEEAAKTCAQSWRESPHHWQIMEPNWDVYCYTMLKGADSKRYYCIGLVANGKIN